VQTFKIEPLNDGDSKKLFFNAVFGSEGEGGCPKEFQVVADGIIRKCGGLPLLTLYIASLLLPNKPNPAIQQWEKVESSLPSTLRTNPTSQANALILAYNELPLHLKTCLLYFSMYPEGCTIWKDDLVKQWVAESFSAGDIELGYFDELVRRGMIQSVDTNYHGEVLSCTVNHMVLDLIRYKSMEDNFVITLNYLESTLGLPDKARRLSVQFGGAKGAKIPESIGMSQVRSLLFCGFSGCVPSILYCGLLRVLILHITGVLAIRISMLPESLLASPCGPPDRRYGWRLLSVWARTRPTLNAASEGRDSFRWWNHLAPCKVGELSAAIV
jgi:hypothetical protein